MAEHWYQGYSAVWDRGRKELLINKRGQTGFVGVAGSLKEFREFVDKREGGKEMDWYYVELTYATGKGRASIEPIKPKAGTYVMKVRAEGKRDAVKRAKAQLNKELERQAKRQTDKTLKQRAKR